LFDGLHAVVVVVGGGGVVVVGCIKLIIYDVVLFL
jgi:hypothetical protein